MAGPGRAFANCADALLVGDVSEVRCRTNSYVLLRACVYHRGEFRGRDGPEWIDIRLARRAKSTLARPLWSYARRAQAQKRLFLTGDFRSARAVRPAEHPSIRPE